MDENFKSWLKKDQPGLEAKFVEETIGKILPTKCLEISSALNSIVNTVIPAHKNLLKQAARGSFS